MSGLGQFRGERVINELHVNKLQQYYFRESNLRKGPIQFYSLINRDLKELRPHTCTLVYALSKRKLN